MKAKDLRERSNEDLKELEKSLAKDTFTARFKNFTNRLDDTSSIKKAKKDLARVKTVLTQRTKGLTPVAKSEVPASTSGSAPAASEEAPKTKAKKAAAPKAAAKSAAAEAPAAAPSAAKKTATKKTAKKSEAE